jgi:hypothetical protein
MAPAGLFLMTAASPSLPVVCAETALTAAKMEAKIGIERILLRLLPLVVGSGQGETDPVELELP